MRSLPPLTLSPILSSFPSLPPISEGMEPALDSCLPELLACDLEVSKGVFAAKNMTAGAPAACMSIEDKMGKMGKMGLPPFGRTTSPLPPHVIPPRVQSLRTIQERCSMVSFLDQRGSTSYDDKSDSDSTSDTELSGAVEAPSVSFRHQPVHTAPTSVASTQRIASPRHSPRLASSRGCSWIDGDSDYEAQFDSTIDRYACLSPRPPTPPDVTTGLARGITREMRRHSHTTLQYKSFSAGCTPSRSPERRLSIKSEEPALKRSCSQRVNSHDCGSSIGFNLAPFSPGSKSTHQDVQEPLSPLTLSPPSPTFEHHHANNLCPATTFDSRLDESVCSGRGPHYSRPQTIYVQPSPPPSPLPSVQSWLCSGSQPHASQFANDELAKAVPLPPNIIETLRVSIACFPETMLLTHSLTIETIRSYAKKVRQPTAEVLRSPLSEPLQPTTRKSIWKKVASYRRGSPSGHRRQNSSGTIDRSGLKSASSNSLDVVKPWAPLQNIFGNTSDYICDALYAHIAAYNYITALVPRNQLAKSRRNSHTPGEVQHEDIPKKAASLLGLTSAAELSPAHVSGLIKNISGSFLKDATSNQAAVSPSYESAVRDIQAGLMRCITRLVATARLVAESGTGEERLVEMGASEVDMMLTRSLCEVVRLAEESAPGL